MFVCAQLFPVTATHMKAYTYIYIYIYICVYVLHAFSGCQKALRRHRAVQLSVPLGAYGAATEYFS